MRESQKEKLYDEGKIGWNEYLKLALKRKEELRRKYKGNETFELYDAGLITLDEFLESERKNSQDA